MKIHLELVQPIRQLLRTLKNKLRQCSYSILQKEKYFRFLVQYDDTENLNMSCNSNSWENSKMKIIKEQGFLHYIKP